MHAYVFLENTSIVSAPLGRGGSLRTKEASRSLIRGGRQTTPEDGAHGPGMCPIVIMLNNMLNNILTLKVL